ncbi:MAG TPA: hypothetical protein VGC12_05495 [Methyloradius sp.]
MLTQCLKTTATRLALVLIVSLSLSGCIGGPIAQQIASSLASSVASQATSDAYDAQLIKEAQADRDREINSRQPDKYWAAFITAGFNKVEPVQEAVPETIKTQFAETAPRTTKIQGNQLAEVELWNLLIGDEKQEVLQKARMLGATNLPPQDEWASWQLGTGAINGDNKQQIVFLIPPSFGRLKSGERTVVEIAGAGELSIARYQIGNPSNQRLVISHSANSPVVASQASYK